MNCFNGLLISKQLDGFSSHNLFGEKMDPTTPLTPAERSLLDAIAMSASNTNTVLSLYESLASLGTGNRPKYLILIEKCKIKLANEARARAPDVVIMVPSPHIYGGVLPRYVESLPPGFVFAHPYR